ncbi:hypothetical protein NpNSSI1_00010145 [Neofusicoccum parvum]|nr:hypothetical protein NpNSSI1_00010145 [Neofusicoccum parvum]
MDTTATVKRRAPLPFASGSGHKEKPESEQDTQNFYPKLVPPTSLNSREIPFTHDQGANSPTEAAAQQSPPAYTAQQSPPTYSETVVADSLHRLRIIHDHLIETHARLSKHFEDLHTQTHRIAELAAQLHSTQSEPTPQAPQPQTRLHVQLVQVPRIRAPQPPTQQPLPTLLRLPTELTQRILLLAAGPNLLRRSSAALIRSLPTTPPRRPGRPHRGRFAAVKAFCATEAANAPADDLRALWASEVRKYARVCVLFDVCARLRADMEWVERRWLRGGGYERTLGRWGFSTWLHEGAGEGAVVLQLYPWVRVSAAAAVPGSEWTEWELGWLRLMASMPATVERVQLRDLTAADGRRGVHALLGMRLVQHIKCLLAKQRPGCEVEVVRQHEERPLALGL